MKNLKPLKYVQLGILILHFTLSLLSVASYPGSLLYFSLFTLSFLLLILSAVSSLNSPSFLFFGIMLWLGFFCKTTLHLILKYPFAEPIGKFTAQPAEWNQTLLVASIGALGCVFAKGLFDRIQKSKKENIFLAHNNILTAPTWFVKHRYAVYFLFGSIVVFVAAINIAFGINLSGHAAVTVLPWPLNALIGWLLYIGFAIVIAQISLWEYSITRTNNGGYLLSIFEGLFSSVSVLSRGLFIFHIAPMIVVNVLNKALFNFKWKRVLLYFSLTILCFLLNSSGVTLLRAPLFDNDSFMYDFYDINDKDAFLFELPELQHKETPVAITPIATPPLAPPSQKAYSIRKTIENASAQDNKIFRISKQIAALSVDRWIGVEGVMAVSTYPDKNMKLLYYSLTRKPQLGEQDIYEKISNSLYQPSMKYSFASIPGPIALFYYANSLLLVFLGLFIFTAIMLLTDQVIFSNFRNCFLSAQISFYLANGLAQFGISPRPLLISFFMTACGLCALKAFLFMTSKYESA